MNENLKNIIIGAVVVLVIGGAAYFYMTREPYIEEPLLTGVQTASSAVSLDGSFISALSSLRRLRLDDSIFKNPAWDTLTDFGKTLAPQPYGRPNPFAPINGSPVSTTTGETQ
jgi:hypothetical protein